MSEFSPRCCQKYLSYITGTSLYHFNCTLTIVNKLIRLASCDRMAGIGRRSFISGWNNYSRFSCSQSPIIRTSKMARYTSCHSSRDILYLFQHFLLKKATACRSVPRGCSYTRTLRDHDSTVDFGTAERCFYRIASIHQWWQLGHYGGRFHDRVIDFLGFNAGI